MIDYKCSRCGLTGFKLWRQYQTCASAVELLCATCAENDQDHVAGKSIAFAGDVTDQIGWLVPAIPVDGEDTFWGYSSTPDEGCLWWHQLPTFKDLDREAAWIQSWTKNWENRAKYYAESLGEAFEREAPVDPKSVQALRERLGRVQRKLQELTNRKLARWS